MHTATCTWRHRLFDAKRNVGLLTPADQAARAMQVRVDSGPGAAEAWLCNPRPYAVWMWDGAGFGAARVVVLLLCSLPQMKMRNIHPGAGQSASGGFSLWHALSKKTANGDA